MHSSEELQLIMASCYTDLLRLVTNVSIYYSWKQTSKFSFEELKHNTNATFKLLRFPLEALMRCSPELSSLSLCTATDSRILSGPPVWRLWQDLVVSTQDPEESFRTHIVKDISVDLVRDFLTPHDRVTRLLAVTRHIKKPRADFTW